MRVGSNYTVRILPNDMILVIDLETKERNILKPQQLAKFFEERLDKQMQTWDDLDENFEKVQSELSKL